MKMHNIRKKIYDFMMCILPYRIVDKCQSKLWIYNAKKTKENIPSDKTYYVKNNRKRKCYVLFRIPVGQGLFSVALIMILYFDWAIRNRLIPLVIVGYRDDLSRGDYSGENRWEFCFEQENIARVIKEENVIVNALNAGETLKETCAYINNNCYDIHIHAPNNNYKIYYKRLNKMVNRTWKFNSIAEEIMNGKDIPIYTKEMRVVGVMLREEFSLRDEEMSEAQKLIYGNHPKSPSLENIYKVVEEYFEKWNCTHVFVSTMYQESLDFFVEKMKDKVLYTKRQRKSFSEYMKVSNRECEAIVSADPSKLSEIQRENVYFDIKQNELDYFSEIVALSKCDCCIGVKCSGLTAACILNGGSYEELFIFDDPNEISRY